MTYDDLKAYERPGETTFQISDIAVLFTCLRILFVQYTRCMGGSDGVQDMAARASIAAERGSALLTVALQRTGWDGYAEVRDAQMYRIYPSSADGFAFCPTASSTAGCVWLEEIAHNSAFSNHLIYLHSRRIVGQDYLRFPWAPYYVVMNGYTRRRSMLEDMQNGDVKVLRSGLVSHLLEQV